MTQEEKELYLEELIEKELDETWYGEYAPYDKLRESLKRFFELGFELSLKIKKIK